MHAFQLPPPDLLAGGAPEEREMKLVTWRVDDLLGSANRHSDLGAEAVAGEVTMDFNAFYRTLGKIGHAFAWAELRGRFEPFLPTIILRSEGDAYQFIGGQQQRKVTDQGLHRIELGEVVVRGDLIVTVLLQLFASLRSPVIYEICAGRRD